MKIREISSRTVEVEGSAPLGVVLQRVAEHFLRKADVDLRLAQVADDSRKLGGARTAREQAGHEATASIMMQRSQRFLDAAKRCPRSKAARERLYCHARPEGSGQ